MKKTAGKAPAAETGGAATGRGAPAAAADQSAVDWEAVVGTLKKWKKAAAGDPERGIPGEPSVTTVAERYKNDPWAVLVSTILSLRTKDEVTLKCSRALLEKAPTPRALLGLDEKTVAALAYPAGFYRTKAVNLKRIAAILLEQYQGRVPGDLDTLLELPGVGRKTANLVITEAYNKYGICVDIHVHRISNRAGWVASRNPEETEMILRRILPKKFWKPINPLLVLYGQNICRPVSPFCSRCVIRSHCRRLAVEKSR